MAGPTVKFTATKYCQVTSFDLEKKSMWFNIFSNLFSSICLVCFDDFVGCQHDDDIGREWSVTVTYVQCLFSNQNFPEIHTYLFHWEGG